MDIKTYMKRAYRTQDMNRSNYHESNALHHLMGQIKYLSDDVGMTGHDLNKYGKHVISRLKEIINDFDTGKELGKKLKANVELMKNKGGE
jgi:hypothetical protein